MEGSSSSDRGLLRTLKSIGADFNQETVGVMAPRLRAQPPNGFSYRQMDGAEDWVGREFAQRGRRTGLDHTAT